MSDEESREQSFALPQPGPEHRLLAPFEGRFRATVKLWFGPGDPMVTTGVMVNTFVLGGLYLQQDYVGDPSGGPFSSFCGKGFWGYNTATGAYEGFWIDTASTIMQIESGEVDDAGKVWTMRSNVVDPSGKPLAKRSVITLVDNDRHRMESYFATDGIDFKSMEIEYVRADA